MAKATFNAAVKGVSGKSGNWVFRQLNDQTFISRRPETPTKAPSAAQLAQRRKFRSAGEYAQRVLSDPWQRRMYETMAKERQRTVDRLVQSDFLTPPVIESIELADFRARTGDLIRIIATDDIEVVSVHVLIRNASGLMIEEGNAAKIHGVWIYTATAAAPAGEKLMIVATARDRPDHEGTLTVLHP